MDEDYTIQDEDEQDNARIDQALTEQREIDIILSRDGQ